MGPRARRATRLLLLFALGLVWYGPRVLAPGRLGDEGQYFDAFESVLAGRSPYDVAGYYYPPAFALVGARMLGAFGEHPTAIALRLANLTGVVAACACAVCWMPARGRARHVTAAALLCLAPPVNAAMTYGNVSGLACGAVLASLVTWRRAPAAAGALLGGSLVLKPVGALVVLLACARRPLPWVAAGCTLAVAAVGLAFGARELPAMAALSSAAHERSSTSVVHVLDCFGVHVPGVLVAAIVAAAGVVVRTRFLPWHAVGLVACSASILASPLVWDHTMILALPLVVATVTPPVRAALRARGPERSRALLAVLVATFGALVLFGTREWTAIPGAPRWLEGALGLVPLVTLAWMTAAAVRASGGPSAGRPRGPGRAAAPR